MIYYELLDVSKSVYIVQNEKLLQTNWKLNKFYKHIGICQLLCL